MKETVESIYYIASRYNQSLGSQVCVLLDSLAIDKAYTKVPPCVMKHWSAGNSQWEGKDSIFSGTVLYFIGCFRHIAFLVTQGGILLSDPEGAGNMSPFRPDIDSAIASEERYRKQS